MSAMRQPTPSRRRRTAGLVTALATVVVSFVAAPEAAATPPAPAPATAPNAVAGPSVDITLITGDKVRYQTGPGGQAQVTVVEAVSTEFRGEEPPDGGLYLYPDLAEPYVASGKLDRELFNIEYLATHGYDDSQMDQLPLIVDYAGTGPAAASRARGDARGLAAARTGPVLHSIGAVGVSMDKANADRFWQTLAPPPPAGTVRGSLAAGALDGGVDKIWLDRKVQVTLDESVPLIGAPEAWDAGLDGSGVTVAVLDTGYDPTHPDLAGKVVASASFVSDTAADGHGHGTHVASTIAGSGAASDGQYKGVAPGADLVVGKVLDDGGSGTFAQIVAGMEWAAQEQDADIISMSLGAEGDFLDGTDPASQAVNNLTATTGALFVIAAGNSGPGQQTLQTPAVADASLAVAATVNPIPSIPSIELVASFSSRGPRVDGVLKPDISAPGVNIVAARAAGTALCQGACMPGDGPVNESYTSASGTSMATPHVAGAAAILAQQHPDWTPEQIKTTLMSTSLGLSLGGTPISAYEQGAGRVDVARVVSQQLRTDTASISPGILELDEPPRSVPVTYLNDSTGDLTVTVEAALRGPDGQPAADGVLSLDQDTFTVPAGGSTTLTATIDVSAATQFGLHDGVITASTEAGDSLRTPIGVTIQPPLNDLTVRLVTFAPEFRFDPRVWSALRIDDQEVPWQASIVFEGVNQGNQVIEGTTRVPDGSYFVVGDPDWSRQYRNSAWIVEEVSVNGDTVITIDMRDLVPVTATADQPTELVWRTEYHGVTTEAGQRHTSFTIGGLPATHREWRYPIEPVSRGELWAREGFILSQPQLLLDLRAGGRHTVLQPKYPDQPAKRDDRYPKFTQDTDTVLATEADIDAGQDVRDALVLMPLVSAFVPCPGGEPHPDCAVVNRAQKAAEAGAAGVLFTLEGRSLEGLNRVNRERFVSQLPVPVLWLDDAQADQLAGLLDSGKPVEVRMDVALEPAYEYKLWFRESGQVPADMTYEVSSRDLKRIDTSYHGNGSAEAGLHNAYETMHAFWPGENLSFATVRHFDAPTRRVEYYRPTGPEVVHSLGHTILYGPYQRNGDDWRTLVGTAPESTTWGTVATPGQIRLDGIARDDAAFAACAVCRQGDDLWVFPRPTMGDGSWSWSGYDTSVRLFDAGGTEIPAAGTGAFPLPPESGRYRLEHVQTDQGPDNLYGREVRTEWEFTASARPEVNEVEFPYGKPDFFDPAPAAWQPVIFLNYDIPLALDNTARAGRPIMFTVYAAAGEPGSGADIRGLELEASFDDGATWTGARVIRPLGDGQFWVMVKHPKLSDTTGAVTLRTHAWDDAGNEVTQTVERAYGLR